MIAIVDYGVGNLFSLKSSLGAIGAEVVVTAEEGVIRRADKLILPGVGAFEDAAKLLEKTGLGQVVVEQARGGKPLLGICLGMQLLFEESEEYGRHRGLGIIPGRVVSMEPVVPRGYKVPHIGWNALHFPKGRPADPCSGTSGRGSASTLSTPTTPQSARRASLPPPSTVRS